MKYKFWSLLMFGLVLPISLYSSLSFAATADHLQNAAQGKCLHATNDLNMTASNCVANEPKQTWSYSAAKQLVNANGKCLRTSSRNTPVYLSTCSLSSSRIWTYDTATQRYRNSSTGQCLNVYSNGQIWNTSLC